MANSIDVGACNSTVSKHSSTSNAVSYMRDLDRIQEQQVVYAGKIEKERKRKEKTEEDIRNAKNELLKWKAATRNGKIVKDEETVHKKYLVKLEHQVQMANTKLSASKGANANLKNKIDQLRMDKLLHMSILKDIDNELQITKKKNAEAHKEIVVVNDKKHRAKIEVSNIKNRMLSDIEEFAIEMDKAKSAINNTQATILESIRERLMNTTTVPTVHHLPTKQSTQDDKPRETDFATNQQEIASMLEEIGITNLNDLLTNLQATEEQSFGLYKKIQAKNAEVETIDLENKQLESELSIQTSRLDELESHNNHVRQDLEQHISTIQKSIVKYESDYNSHVEVLDSISENLMNLLRNIAIDEEALDQQLLSAGITDRNVDSFLGLIEQRIDDLIQMSKAAGREMLHNNDFVQLPEYTNGQASLLIPSVPSLGDGGNNDDDDGDDDGTRIQPISVTLLKEYMQKRIQKSLQKKTSHASTAATSNAIARAHSNVSSTDADITDQTDNKSLAIRKNGSDIAGELPPILE